MPRNIVILLDGTSNEIETDRTNILRLYGTLKKSDRQIVWYHPGVGTLGAANSWFPRYRKLVEIWGLATGWGLDQNVKDAYRFLANTYQDGDQIYIFGFSRGAYTARVLAGFIHAVGLFEPTNLNLVDYAYRAYKKITDDHREIPAEDQATGGRFAEVRLFERMLDPRRPMIRCLGLFDTVGSVIEMGRWWPVRRFYAFTRKNPSVEAVRHALAIDERRTMFQPTLWPKDVDYRCPRFQPEDVRPQDVEEVWFTGSHCDVGGGYSENRSQLAKIALAWMIERTGPLGLDYSAYTVNRVVCGTHENTHYVKPDPLAPINDSMNGFWPALEFIPRRLRKHADLPRPTWFGFYLPLFSRRTIPSGSDIHWSVFERRGTPQDIDQPNIPEDHNVVGQPA